MADVLIWRVHCIIISRVVSYLALSDTPNITGDVSRLARSDTPQHYWSCVTPGPQ